MRRLLIHCGPSVKYSPYITLGAENGKCLRGVTFEICCISLRLFATAPPNTAPFVSRSSSAVREGPSNLRGGKKRKGKDGADVMISVVNVNCTQVKD